MKVATGNPVPDLETKRQKVIAGGAPPDSVRICTICNVVCNSDKVFAFHLAGEKHALKVNSYLVIGPGHIFCIIYCTICCISKI